MVQGVSRPRVIEIVPVCVLAGTGMILTGTYVDWVANFTTSFNPRLLAIIPPLIGLKGNLEVTLSSRLATMINIKSELSKESLYLFLSTLAYILIQGLSAGLLISVLAVFFNSSFPLIGEQTYQHLIHLVTVSVVTCALVLSTLSFLVFGLIIGCFYLGIDPDNVAPPVAAALGDISTVGFLLYVDTWYTAAPYAASVVAVSLLILVLLIGPYQLRHKAAQQSDDLDDMSISCSTFSDSVLPLGGAILMSSLSGQVLAYFASHIPNLTRLQIAINGVGGCFGSIVVSRMITRIHMPHGRSSPPPIPSGGVVNKQPDSAHTTASISHQTPPLPPVVVKRVAADGDAVKRVILLACVPVHFILASVSLALHHSLGDRSHTFTMQTIAAYLFAGFCQVFVILHFAKWIVLVSWQYLLCKPNPTTCCSGPISSDITSNSLASLDLIAIALTTGLGDLLGSIFLTISLYCAQS